MEKRMKRTYRVAIIGVGCENCTFSTKSTVLEDFRPMLDESALEAHYKVLTTAQAGTPLDLAKTQFLESSFADIAFCYCCRCRAIPGGPIDTEAFATLLKYIEDALKRHLKSGALDGVYLDLHGAMFANGYEDAEGEIVTLVRSLVGEDALLSASFDLHGNFSKRIAQTLNMLTAYRTAPHIDCLETELKALSMLATCLRSGHRPHVAYCPIPLGISGEMSNTADEPSKSLYSSVLHETDGKSGILDASIFIGYVWADEKRTGSSVLVTGLDADIAREEASRIASCVWTRRQDFRFGVEAGSVDDMIDRAVELASHRKNDDLKKPVIISDSGDNPTAGGVGDTPTLVEHLVRKGVQDAMVQGPTDSIAVEACISAGVGASVQLDIGGKLDYLSAKPFRISGTVQFVNTNANLTYEVDVNAGSIGTPQYVTRVMPRAAVLKIPTAKGHVFVTLTAERKPFHYEKDFQMLELEPALHPILVVKIGYLVPDLERMSAVNLMALSPGSVFADVKNIAYKNVPRPIYPQDKDMQWSPSLC
eukprot:gnl/MRDRNA2_/MRDRNA2_28218_c0_seq1.p1 gnl/MRDRNA2_/MRDRNA2_28218_c0~~gnl/MRDRNA2_/MRDRNA2_28218_c0_seq1.p1  ORF type:complete len:535 (+),score=88.44 gnl/MRDRNA2_/MRDRNA2_28218_c0_seq1:151-1755(+)